MTIPIERTAMFGGPQRFDLLGNIIDDPCNFAVQHGHAGDNLQEFAAWARANPGKLTVGTTAWVPTTTCCLLMLSAPRASS